MRGFSLMELRRLAGRGDLAGESSLLARLSGIPTFKELRPALDSELRRSRRYERPLTALVVVPDIDPWHWAKTNGSPVPDYTPDASGLFAAAGGGLRRLSDNGHAAVGNGGNNGDAGDEQARQVPSSWAIHSAQLRFLLLGSLLCGALRESDVVSYAADHHQFFALLPECDLTAARQAVERLHMMYFSRTRTGVRAGVAAYPANGLTLEALVEHSRHVLFQEPIRPAISGPRASEVAYG